MIKLMDLLLEGRDKKRWFVGKNQFKRIVKNTTRGEVEQLVHIAKKNGDIVDEEGDSVFVSTPESDKAGKLVWKYYNGKVFFVNPYFPSVYDELIPKLLK